MAVTNFNVGDKVIASAENPRVKLRGVCTATVVSIESGKHKNCISIIRDGLNRKGKPIVTKEIWHKDFWDKLEPSKENI